MAGGRTRLSNGPPLAWEIRRDGDSGDGYLLMIPTSLDFFILTYGNEKAGVWGLHWEMEKAMVAATSGLKEYSLGDCVKFVIDSCEPNHTSDT